MEWDILPRKKRSASSREILKISLVAGLTVFPLQKNQHCLFGEKRVGAKAVATGRDCQCEVILGLIPQCSPYGAQNQEFCARRFNINQGCDTDKI